MKKHITILATLIFTSAFAQSPNWQWAKSIGSTSGSYGTSVTTDASGNVLMAGSFTSSSIALGSTTLNNWGSDDMVLVKYDGAGNVLWAKSAGGSAEDDARSVATDASGNILVTGTFASASITFGSFVLTNVDPSGTTYDLFIVKYDGAGNVLWAKSDGGTSHDEAQSVATDVSGNILVAGCFQSSTITFGSNILTNINNGNDMFVVKYDGGGNVLWAKSAGGSSDDAAKSVATDASGNIIVAGYFQSSSITFGASTYTNAGTIGTYDMYIVKYDGAGNVLWAKSAGGSQDDEAHSIAIDTSGNIFVTGIFTFSSAASCSITFGSITLNSSTNVFLVKYDGAGNVLWAKASGGVNVSGSNGNAQSLATDVSGNVLITGYFGTDVITFGSTTLNNTGNCSGTMNCYNIFLVKYDGLGNVLWAKRVGGGGNFDYAFSVSTDTLGDIFVTGIFSSSSITFDATILPHTTGGYSFDIFVAKLFDPLMVTTSQMIIKCPGQSITVATHTYTNSGTYTDTLTSYKGYDSIVNTFLTVLSPNTFSQIQTICAKKNLVVGSHTYTTSGTYIDTLTSYQACDSIVNTLLTVLSPNTFSQSDSICTGKTFVIGSHTYTIGGTYIDTLISFQGCDSVVNTYLTVYNNPIANFSVVPMYSVLEPQITITDSSSGAYSWQWNFGDGNSLTSYTNQLQAHSYKNEGTFTITLITTSEFGCIDSTFQKVNIEQPYLFYIPNAFSPNGDNKNETFTGKGEGIENFAMMIFDRWGNMVFSSNDINMPWDGRTNGGTKVAQIDTYVYVFHIRDIKNNDHTYRGTLMLMK